MKDIIEQNYRSLVISQDLGLGMMLWMTHFFPAETWRVFIANGASRCLTLCGSILPAYFCREPGAATVKFAFTNYGVSLGLQAVETWPDRVARLMNSLFEDVSDPRQNTIRRRSSDAAFHTREFQPATRSGHVSTACKPSETP